MATPRYHCIKDIIGSRGVHCKVVKVVDFNNLPVIALGSNPDWDLFM
jgi:hypothetical protein